MEAEHVSEVERQIEESGTEVTLDLEEVTLVDVQVVRFLGTCEIRGISVLNRSPYITDWIAKEQRRPSAFNRSRKRLEFSPRLNQPPRSNREPNYTPGMASPRRPSCASSAWRPAIAVARLGARGQAVGGRGTATGDASVRERTRGAPCASSQARVEV